MFRIVLLVNLLTINCTTIKQMEERNNGCLTFCKEKYGEAVLAMANGPCACTCFVLQPLGGE